MSDSRAGPSLWRAIRASVLVVAAGTLLYAGCANEERGVSAAAQHLQGPRETVGQPRPELSFGSYHALVIGNNTYRQFRPLRTAVNDAQEVANILRGRYRFNVILLTNATRQEILSALNALRKKLTSKDNLLIYYAGHGDLDERNQRCYWLPVDAEPNSTANWIATRDITDILNATEAKQLLVMADACYWGTLPRSVPGELDPGMTEDERFDVIQKMAQKRSRMVLTSGGFEPVLDSAGGTHSAFAEIFIQVLRENDGVLLGREVSHRWQQQVTSQRLAVSQVPAYAPIQFAGHEAGDFVLPAPEDLAEFERPKKDGPPNFAVVRVFYATDRQLGTPSPVMFTSTRNPNGDLTLGTFDISIPREHRLGNIERPLIWRLEFRADRAKHFVVLHRTIKGAPLFYEELAQRVQRSENKEALVFIHGYNVSFDDAVYRTAQIAYDLGFGGAPILYSWPSNGRTLEYPGDVNNSEWSIDHLKVFLKQVVARSRAERIHLVAHSMGNRVLAGALERLTNDPTFAPLPKFTHVILTAPDIDAGVFTQLADTIRKTAGRVTLYASSSDKALKVSKQINGYPRAGDAGAGILVITGIDTIDVSAVDTDLIGHSYYGDNRSVLSDMFNLLRGQSPPRFGLKEAAMGTLKYWRFAP